MNASKMLRLCGTARKQLDELSSALSNHPGNEEAQQFFIDASNDVHELKGIAKYETSYSVTVEQAAHINRILSQAALFTKMVKERRS